MTFGIGGRDHLGDAVRRDHRSAAEPGGPGREVPLLWRDVVEVDVGRARSVMAGEDQPDRSRRIRPRW